MKNILGVSFGQKVIFNLLDEEPEFTNTGYSLINFLGNDKNKFIASVVQSQSYDSIKCLYDHNLVYSEYFSTSNENIEDLQNIINSQDELDYIYIYDYESDLLLVKNPCTKLQALNWRSEEDVRNYALTHKDPVVFIERDF